MAAAPIPARWRLAGSSSRGVRRRRRRRWYACALRWRLGVPRPEPYTYHDDHGDQGRHCDLQCQSGPHTLLAGTCIRRSCSSACSRRPSVQVGRGSGGGEGGRGRRRRGHHRTHHQHEHQHHPHHRAAHRRHRRRRRHHCRHRDGRRRAAVVRESHDRRQSSSFGRPPGGWGGGARLLSLSRWVFRQSRGRDCAPANTPWPRLWASVAANCQHGNLDQVGKFGARIDSSSCDHPLVPFRLPRSTSRRWRPCPHTPGDQLWRHDNEHHQEGATGTMVYGRDCPTSTTCPHTRTRRGRVSSHDSGGGNRDDGDDSDDDCGCRPRREGWEPAGDRRGRQSWRLRRNPRPLHDARAGW